MRKEFPQNLREENLQKHSKYIDALGLTTSPNYFLVTGEDNVVYQKNLFHDALIDGNLNLVRKMLAKGVDISIPAKILVENRSEPSGRNFTSNLYEQYVFELCCKTPDDSALELRNIEDRFEIFKLLSRNLKNIKTLLSDSQFPPEEKIRFFTLNIQKSFNLAKQKFLDKQAFLPATSREEIEAVNIDPERLSDGEIEFYRKNGNPYLTYRRIQDEYSEIQQEIRECFEKEIKSFSAKGKKSSSPKFPENEYILQAMVYGVQKDSEYLASIIPAEVDYYQTDIQKIYPIKGDSVYKEILGSYCQRLNAYAILNGDIREDFYNSGELFPQDCTKNIINFATFLHDFEGLEYILKFSPSLNKYRDDKKTSLDLLLCGIENSRNSPRDNILGVHEMIFCGADYSFEKTPEQASQAKEKLLEFVSNNSDANSLEQVEEFGRNLDLVKSFKEELLKFSQPNSSKLEISQTMSRLDEMTDYYLKDILDFGRIKDGQISDFKVLKVHRDRFYGEDGQEKVDHSLPEHILNFSGFLNYVKDFGVYDSLFKAKSQDPASKNLLYKIDQLSHFLSRNCEFRVHQRQLEFEEKFRDKLRLQEELIAQEESERAGAGAKKKSKKLSESLKDSANPVAKQTKQNPQQPSVVNSTNNSTDNSGDNAVASRLDLETPLQVAKSVSKAREIDEAQTQTEGVKISELGSQVEAQTQTQAETKKLSREIATQTDFADIRNVADSGVQAGVPTSDFGANTPYYMINPDALFYDFNRGVSHSDINALRLLQQDKNIDKKQIFFRKYEDGFCPVNLAFLYSTPEFFQEFYQSCQDLILAHELDREELVMSVLASDQYGKNSLFYLTSNDQQSNQDKIAKLEFLTQKLNPDEKWSFINQKDFWGFRAIDYAINDGNQDLAFNIFKQGVDLNDQSQNIVHSLYLTCNFDLMQKCYDNNLFKFSQINPEIIGNLRNQIFYDVQRQDLNQYQKNNVQNFGKFISDKLKEEGVLSCSPVGWSPVGAQTSYSSDSPSPSSSVTPSSSVSSPHLERRTYSFRPSSSFQSSGARQSRGDMVRRSVAYSQRRSHPNSQSF